MAREIAPSERTNDVDAVTQAVLTASRLLVAVSARSLAHVEDRVTLPQFRMLVVLSTRGTTKLVTLAESRKRSGYGPYLPIGRNGSMNFHWA
ncbi:hypothetical protein SMICM17S_10189 [Streptomyces microflavus]